MKSVLILADIEGSTGCSKVEDSRLFNDGWIKACIELSRDLAAVCKALQEAGVRRIRIKDFHRTGYNIFKELLPDGIELDQGYRSGPIPGIGDAAGFELLMMIGLHAASGTDGFLPHTLTSKFSSIIINGKALTEAELFATSVASTGLVPVFFSGCQIACSQAEKAIPGLQSFAVNKPTTEPLPTIRMQLANAAVASLQNTASRPFCPPGPFNAVISMRDGMVAAQKLRQRWQFAGQGDQILCHGKTMSDIYWQLIKLAYLTPVALKFIGSSLWLANQCGRLALIWAKHRALSFRDR